MKQIKKYLGKIRKSSGYSGVVDTVIKYDDEDDNKLSRDICAECGAVLADGDGYPGRENPGKGIDIICQRCYDEICDCLEDVGKEVPSVRSRKVAKKLKKQSAVICRTRLFNNFEKDIEYALVGIIKYHDGNDRYSVIDMFGNGVVVEKGDFDLV